jgi:hypothetical protein
MKYAPGAYPGPRRSLKLSPGWPVVASHAVNVADTFWLPVLSMDGGDTHVDTGLRRGAV